MKRFLLLCAILAIALFLCSLEILWVDSVRWTSAKAENIQEQSFIFLPVVLNNPSDEPIWVKNPDNLPPPNGWPGWTNGIRSGLIDCPAESCEFHTFVQSPPEYLILEGRFATFPFLLEMGGHDSCYAVVVTESYIWQEQGIDFTPDYPITLKFMSVPDPSIAPPLEWVAQARVDVMVDIPGCTNPDIGIYAKPSRLK